jgi:hypothetical protein
MAYLLTSLSLFWLWLPFLNDNRMVSLDEALKNGMITLEAGATGGHSGQSLKLNIMNHQPGDWVLQIQAGEQFASEDPGEQDLIVIRRQSLAMKEKGAKEVLLQARCTQAGNRSPSSGSGFRYAGPAEGKLAKLVNFIDQAKIVDHPAQEAIWTVTNGHSLAYIDHEELQKLSAALLGVEKPTYAVESRPVPPSEEAGRTAFEAREPALLKGAFACQLEKDIQASFGLYNEEGEELLQLFANRTLRKGTNRMRFSFEISDLERGTYYARLSSEGRVVEEEAMIW